MSKDEGKGFFNHSRNYLIAEFFNKGIVFLTIPLFTYLLSPEDYGVISIYATIISILIVFMGLNIHASVQRHYHDEFNEFNEFLGTNILFLVFLNTLLVFLFIISQDYLSSFLSIDSRVLFVAVIVSSLSVFLQVELSYLQTSQQSKKYVKILVIRNILLTLGAAIWMYLLDDHRYLGKVYSELLIMCMIFIFVIYDLLKLSKFNINIKFLKYSLSYGAPLIPHTLSGLILLLSDRLIINQLSGSYETGLYSFAFNVGMIMSVVVTSFNNAWIPIFYKDLKEKSYDKIQNSSERYIKIIFIVSLLLVLFSKEIVIIMADKKYYVALNIVPLIILSFTMVYLYTLFANYAFYRKKTGLISLFTFIAGIINIGLNYLLIPIFGYEVAAWTTLFSYFMLFLLHYINVKFFLKEKTITLSKILIQLSFLMALIILFLNVDINQYIFHLAFKILLAIIFIIVLFKSEISRELNNRYL